MPLSRSAPNIGAKAALPAGSAFVVHVPSRPIMVDWRYCGGAVAQLGARLDGIEEVVGSNPIGSTILLTITCACVIGCAREFVSLFVP
jgi:hypothetical protein